MLTKMISLSDTPAAGALEAVLAAVLFYVFSTRFSRKKLSEIPY
jgi:hypothetical protein